MESSLPVTVYITVKVKHTFVHNNGTSKLYVTINILIINIAYTRT